MLRGTGNMSSMALKLRNVEYGTRTEKDTRTYGFGHRLANSDDQRWNPLPVTYYNNIMEIVSVIHNSDNTRRTM